VAHDPGVGGGKRRGITSFYWSDIGTLEAYRAAQRDALSGKVRLKIPGAQRSEGLWIARGAQLHPTVTLQGRVGCEFVIGRGSTLIEDTTVESDCRVRPGATIKLLTTNG
jgi:mannose-1-phosphate guanylyltransferase